MVRCLKWWKVRWTLDSTSNQQCTFQAWLATRVWLERIWIQTLQCHHSRVEQVLTVNLSLDNRALITCNRTSFEMKRAMTNQLTKLMILLITLTSNSNSLIWYNLQLALDKQLQSNRQTSTRLTHSWGINGTSTMVETANFKEVKSPCLLLKTLNTSTMR